MKKLMALLLLLPLMATAGQGFVIKGKVSGILNGYVAITNVARLQAATDTSSEALPAKVRIKNGAFVFAGRLKHPGLVNLKISTREIAVFLENTSYTISGALSRLTGASLRGGQANDDWQQYIISGESGSDFMQAHPNSIASAYLALMQATDSYDEAQKGYAFLGPDARKSWYGQQLETAIGEYKKCGVGTTFPALAMHASDGRFFSMRDMTGKVVVLDFWASWCAPCRAYIPTLREYYNKYKDKGVEFVSVSVDSDTGRWKEATATEKMEWNQVLAEGAFDDGKGVKQLLNIYHIPYVIVVGKDGKIAASLDYSKKDQLETILTRTVGSRRQE